MQTGRPFRCKADRSRSEPTPGDDGMRPLRLNLLEQAIAVVGIVGDDRLGRLLSQQPGCPNQIVEFTAAEEVVDRITQRIDHRMDLGGEPSAGVP